MGRKFEVIFKNFQLILKNYLRKLSEKFSVHFTVHAGWGQVLRVEEIYELFGEIIQRRGFERKFGRNLVENEQLFQKILRKFAKFLEEFFTSFE